MDFRDVAPEYEEQHPIWRGIIAKTPDDIEEDIPVILPEWDATLKWGPAKWVFKDDQNIPQEGDECLVVFDNNRVPWITAWIQTSTYVPPTGTGANFSGVWKWTTGLINASNSGDIGLNASTWAAATQIHINEKLSNGKDALNIFTLLSSGNKFFLQDDSNSNNHCTFTLTGSGTDNGTWWTLPVGPSSASGVPPSNNQATDVGIFLIGGSGGTGASTFIFTQGTPLATWNIPHNLNRWPSVSVVDSGGSVVIPSILYVDANNITVTFGSATSGKAYLN